MYISVFCNQYPKSKTRLFDIGNGKIITEDIWYRVPPLLQLEEYITNPNFRLHNYRHILMLMSSRFHIRTHIRGHFGLKQKIQINKSLQLLVLFIHCPEFGGNRDFSQLLERLYPHYLLFNSSCKVRVIWETHVQKYGVANRWIHIEDSRSTNPMAPNPWCKIKMLETVQEFNSEGYDHLHGRILNH